MEKIYIINPNASSVDIENIINRKLVQAQSIINLIIKNNDNELLNNSLRAVENYLSEIIFLHNFSGDTKTKVKKFKYNFIGKTIPLNKHRFSLQIKDEAMDSKKSDALCLGDLIIIDPGQEPKIGDIVLFKVNGNYDIRKFTQEKDKLILQALNPDKKTYPSIILDNTIEVAGTIVDILKKGTFSLSSNNHFK